MMTELIQARVEAAMLFELEPPEHVPLKNATRTYMESKREASSCKIRLT